jgi:site-specific DNA-methyltransferase (adenine-specific)
MKSPNNRTLTLSEKEKECYSSKLISLNSSKINPPYVNVTINGNYEKGVSLIQPNSINLLVADPPYNLPKKYNSNTFSTLSWKEYENFTQDWIEKVFPLLTSDASIYVCCDWKSSSTIEKVLNKYFYLQNRITWQREKGRGSKSNWKNCLEDIWFATVSNNSYYFDVDAVKVKRRVKAPYKENGKPKDWQEESNGNFRLTHPSNFWNDITIPFWSMPENTEHPTQKPEKLIAKLILASSKVDDIVLDPFLGSGTTSVVAKKLKRNYIGIELDSKYACIAEKRLELAEKDSTIQGYEDGVFWKY